MGLLDSLIQSNNSNSSSKTICGISITPGIGMEVAIYDRATGAILNYGRKPLEYNIATREIQVYSEFKQCLLEFIEEMQIKLRSQVYLTLPNVYFDSLEVPADIGAEEVKMAILSKAEEFYLFKREEPVSGFCEVLNTESATQKKFVYSSFQKSAVEQIKEIINEVGLTLIGIETNYSTIIRGLKLAGYIDNLILEEASWTAMIIGANSYTLFQMDGKSLINYSENPIAIKSFSTEEAYQAIIANSYQVLSNFASSKLFVISQTDDISAATLKSQMQFDRSITAIDTNKFATKPVIDVTSALNFDYVNSITLSVIGASMPESDIEFNLNLLNDITSKKDGPYFVQKINGRDVEVTKAMVQQLLILVIIVVLIVMLPIVGIAYFFDGKFKKELGDINQQADEIQRQIDTLTVEQTEETNKQEFDMNSVIDEIAEMNVQAINFYDSISTDIPQNIWLTQYYNQAGAKIAVRGIAQSIIDIYEYYKNLKTVSPQSNIKLNELKVVTNNKDKGEGSYLSDIVLGKDSDRLYSFEISNTQIQGGVSNGDSSQGKENNSRQSFKTYLQDNEDVIIQYGGNSGSSSPVSGNLDTTEVEQPSEQVKQIK